MGCSFPASIVFSFFDSRNTKLKKAEGKGSLIKHEQYQRKISTHGVENLIFTLKTCPQVFSSGAFWDSVFKMCPPVLVVMQLLQLPGSQKTKLTFSSAQF